MDRKYVIAGAVVPGAAALGAGVEASELRVFPSVAADDLNGRIYRLPQDFGSGRSLVLIGFRESHQGDLDTWLSRVARFQALDPSLDYFECPVAPLSRRLMKPFIDAGMRRGIPDIETRGRTITLFVDTAAFRDALGLTSEDRIYVLLLEGDGRVLWSTSGPFGEAKASDLEANLRRAAAADRRTDR